MIGPLGADAYYCHAKESGSCDRRAGVCHCNTGYEGWIAAPVANLHGTGICATLNDPVPVQ